MTAAALLSVACGLYIYFGLSQETTAHYAMKKSRAVIYGIIAFLGVLGAGLAVVSFLFDGWELSAAIGVKAALLFPAVCGLIFMGVTEPKRQKPWLKAIIDRDMAVAMKRHTDMVDPVKAARFGVMSGALWLFAVALCVTIGVFADWRYSWLPPVFALPVQALMTAGIFKKEDK